MKRYSYLIARGWTEKEKVARRRKAEETMQEDTKAKSVTWNECYINYLNFFSYKVPDSIFKTR